MILEVLVLQQHSMGPPTPIFIRLIIDHYTNQKRLIRQSPTLLKSVVITDSPRYFSSTTNTWSDNFESPSLEPSSVTQTTLLQESSEDFNQKYILSNSYGYYGILEIGKADTKFKIRDVRNRELVFGTNKAKIPKGELCGQSFSKKKDGLIGILFHLNYQGPTDKVTLSSREVRDLFIQPSSSVYTKLLEKLQKSQAVDINKFSDKDWKTLYILSKLKLPELCELTRKRLQDLDLVYTKTT
jgi:hypothetical protein